MQWIHGKVLATALTVKKFREMKMEGKIGVILNPSIVYPRTEENPQDVKAAEIADAFYWGSFVDPAVKGEYPDILIDILKKENCLFDATEEELQIIKENTIDILGFNYYQPMRIKGQDFAWNPEAPFHPSKYYSTWDMPGKRMNPYRGWEIYPKALYDVAMRIKNQYGNIEWLVSESGMGVQNEYKYKNAEGEIQDDYRIDYIKEHLAWLSKAVDDGANCKGYWLFASLDNCSPLNAFKNRYGLIEVNLDKNHERRIKKSGHWYKTLGDTNEFEFDDIRGEK
jgi:beta-glucosidase/6-phospho-beta-glucosidase/beta-galactosidase